MEMFLVSSLYQVLPFTSGVHLCQLSTRTLTPVSPGTATEIDYYPTLLMNRPRALG